MRLKAAYLADYAEVINGKLYVHGGLVTQVAKPMFPMPLDLSLVMVFEHTRQEQNTQHQLEIRPIDVDGEPFAPPFTAEIGIGTLAAGTPRGLPLHVPVAARLGMPLPGPGTYAFAILLDTHDLESVQFLVHGPQAPPGGAPPQQ